MSPFTTPAVDAAYLVDSDGNHVRRLTPGYRLDETALAWSPDGSELAVVVEAPFGVRYGVGLLPASGGTPCLVYTTWQPIYGIAWRPGSGSLLPTHCLPLYPPHPSPVLSCTPAGARSAVELSDLSPVLRSDANSRWTPISFTCADFTGGERQDLLVEFWSGGVEGVIEWAAFIPGSGGWRLVLAAGDGCVGATSAGHTLVATTRYHVPGDMGMCGGGVAYRKYRWDGKAFRLEKAWRVNMLQAALSLDNSRE